MKDRLYLFAGHEKVLYLPLVKELPHLATYKDTTRLSFNGT